MGEVGCLKDGNFQNLQVEGISNNPGNLRYKRNIISPGSADRTLTAEESGSIIYISSLTNDYTLPPAEAGLEYYFVCGGAMNAVKISCTAGDAFFGSIRVASSHVGGDDQVATQRVAIDATAGSNDVLTLDGDATTGGGNAGDTLHVVAIDDERWLVVSEGRPNEMEWLLCYPK